MIEQLRHTHILAICLWIAVWVALIGAIGDSWGRINASMDGLEQSYARLEKTLDQLRDLQ